MKEEFSGKKALDTPIQWAVVEQEILPNPMTTQLNFIKGIGLLSKDLSRERNGFCGSNVECNVEAMQVNSLGIYVGT